MEKKITYVEAINSAIEGNMTPEVVDRLRDLIKSLSTKSVSKKQTAKQEAGLALKGTILNLMTSDWVGVADIVATVGGEVTSGQVVSQLTALRHDGLIEAEKHKGKMVYRLSSCEAEAE